MNKIKPFTYFVYFILAILFISSILTVYRLRYLSTSFRVYSNGNFGRINFSLDNKKIQGAILDKNDAFKNKILENSGYTASFDIKTLADNVMFFYTSNEKGGGSIYWNISLVEGKIETARLDSISPIIIDKKINDNQWHHILISVGKEQKIFIDGELMTTTVFGALYLPDEWFNFNIEPTKENPHTIYLKDVFFINRETISREIQAFINRGNIELLTQILAFFALVTAAIVSLILLFLFLIKKEYLHEAFLSIIKKLDVGLTLYIFVVLLSWTPYKTKASLLAAFIFSYYLFKHYKNIFPEDIKLFISAPISFFTTSYKLAKDHKDRKLYNHLLKNKPWVYYLLLIFIALLLVY